MDSISDMSELHLGVWSEDRDYLKTPSRLLQDIIYDYFVDYFKITLRLV